LKCSTAVFKLLTPGMCLKFISTENRTKYQGITNRSTGPGIHDSFYLIMNKPI